MGKEEDGRGDTQLAVNPANVHLSGTLYYRLWNTAMTRGLTGTLGPALYARWLCLFLRSGC